MANITLPLSTGRMERLLHRFDVMLDRIELAIRASFSDPHADLREAAHLACLRRLASRGCGGQAV
jgi:hypothetical protein